MILHQQAHRFILTYQFYWNQSMYNNLSNICPCTSGDDVSQHEHDTNFIGTCQCTFNLSNISPCTIGDDGFATRSVNIWSKPLCYISFSAQHHAFGGTTLIRWENQKIRTFPRRRKRKETRHSKNHNLEQWPPHQLETVGTGCQSQA